MLGLPVAVFAQQRLPELAPVVQSVFPHGAQRGTTVDIALMGQNLDRTLSLEFTGGRVQAEVLSATPRRVQARIVVGPQAEIGLRDFRLRTERGSFVGVFHIGSLPEISEQEPNDDPRQPQPLALPALVNGVIDSEDFDHFLVHAAAGETIFFDVQASRGGSKLDPNLAILDREARELAWSDDHYIYGDPRIEYRFDKAGEYVVRVGSLFGNRNSDYRLIAGRLPHLESVLPSGVTRGETAELWIDGSGLAGTTRVWLGDGLAEGEIVARASRQVKVRLPVPKTIPAGKHLLHLSTDSWEAPAPLKVVVSDVLAITLSEAPVRFDDALPVETPAALNGMLRSPKETHYFRIEAAAGERMVFEAQSMEFGYHLDPVITLFEESGAQLAAADDPGYDERTDEVGLDPTLSYQFEKPGGYIVAIRDSMYRGRPDLIYRLEIRPEQPYFLVEIREPLATAYVGEKAAMLLRLRRRAGWDQPVTIWAEGLPPGVFAEPQVVPAEDSVVKDTCGVDRLVDGSVVYFPIEVSAAAEPGLYHPTIKAKGSAGGRQIERTGVAFYEYLAPGYFFGPMQQQLIDLAITPLPEVILSAPEQLTVEPGETAPFTVRVSRFRDAQGKPLIVSAKNLPPELTLEPVRVEPRSTQLTLKLAALPHVRAEEIPVTLVAQLDPGEPATAESDPIALHVIAKREQ